MLKRYACFNVLFSITLDSENGEGMGKYCARISSEMEFSTLYWSIGWEACGTTKATRQRVRLLQL